MKGIKYIKNICHEFSEDEVISDHKSMTIHTIIHKKYFEDFSKKISVHGWRIKKTKKCQFLRIIELNPSFF